MIYGPARSVPPLLEKRLVTVIGRSRDRSLDPRQHLALGLSRAGSILEGARERVPTPMTLGIAAFGAAAAATAWWRRPGDSLEGEVALVTGGSRGLGYLLARRLLFEGCDVVICGRDAETLRRAVGRLQRESDVRAPPSGKAPEVVGWPCDVRDGEAVGRLVDRIMSRFGRIDLVINNAGVIQVGPLQTMSLEDFRNTMDTDYWGAVYTTLAVLPHMRSEGAGRIVNITSIASDVAVPHLLPYVGAKYAKLGFSDGLRAEVAADGIVVTTVVPGLMRTGSPVHVDFHGQPEKEYAWFTLGSILPVSAMSAERAAARIIRAIRRREARVTLSWQAKTLRMMSAVAPATMTRGFGVINRLLPDDNGAGRPDAVPGTALRGTLPSPVEWALDRAAADTNQ
jgi:NAD(P)-dependent dehydrogenase (short-subunit alcohol dehydrogenase family)